MFNFEKLEELISKLCQRRGFFPLGPFGERHGSWELIYHRRSEELDRFVFVAVTQVTPSHSCDVEVRAGAEDGKHFARHSVGEFRVAEYELVGGPFQDKLWDSVNQAMAIAEQIKPRDLLETYPFPRSKR